MSVGVVATIGGPTCTHGLRSGAAWYPDDWSAMDQIDRLAWLERQRLVACGNGGSKGASVSTSQAQTGKPCPVSENDHGGRVKSLASHE